MFTVLVPQNRRDELLYYLRTNGVEASVHFDPPIHEQPIYKRIKRISDLHVTTQVSRSTITLPMFPGLKLREVDYVCSLIADFMCNS